MLLVELLRRGSTDSGQIAGYLSGNGPGFLDTSGSFNTIIVPGAVQTVASGINDYGQIVGYFFDTGYHGFVETGGILRQLTPPVLQMERLPGGLTTTARSWESFEGTVSLMLAEPLPQSLPPAGLTRFLSGSMTAAKSWDILSTRPGLPMASSILGAASPRLTFLEPARHSPQALTITARLWDITPSLPQYQSPALRLYWLDV